MDDAVHASGYQDAPVRTAYGDLARGRP